MALRYADIINYHDKVGSLTEKAVNELTRRVSHIGAREPERRARFIRMHVRALAQEYGMQEKELGAQWYEHCAKAAGIDVEPAIVGDIDYGRLDGYFDSVLEDYVDGNEPWERTEAKVAEAFESQMRGFERGTILENLDRDEGYSRRRYRQTMRAARKAGYARVPVGETCAWCYMLASLGYFYRSEETALGVEPDHYHAHCDCIAVPYTGPDDIDGYGDTYELYFGMYAKARDDLENGNISPELEQRIREAEERHNALYRSGQTDRAWASVNAITMVMREQNGLDH